MNSPTLSIIVPVYNVENYLDNCIYSVLRQSFCDWELILVDDGSCDRSGEMCDYYAQQDGRIVVIHKTNGGLSDARNAGLNVVQGEYITFLDSDDDIADNTYGPNIDYLLSHPEIDVLQYPTCWGYNSQESKSDNSNPQLFIGEKEIFLNFYKDEPIHGAVWNKIFKREVLSNILFDIGRIYEDRFFMIQLLPQIERLFISSNGCYHYYTRSSSILHSTNLNKSLYWVEIECLTISEMRKYKETQKEQIPRYVKVAKSLMNAKLFFPNAPIEKQLILLNNCKPTFSLCNIADFFWWMIITTFGVHFFSWFYLRLLQMHHRKI